MNLSDNDKAELLGILDHPVFRWACEIVKVQEAEKTDFTRPAADLGVLLAHERGVNAFPGLLRELITTGTPGAPKPPGPKALRPDTKTLR